MQVRVARSRAEVEALERARERALPPHARAEAIWPLFAIHGKIRATKDVDVFVGTDPDNAAKVWRALAVFGAPSVTSTSRI